MNDSFRYPPKPDPAGEGLLPIVFFFSAVSCAGFTAGFWLVEYGSINYPLLFFMALSFGGLLSVPIWWFVDLLTCHTQVPRFLRILASLLVAVTVFGILLGPKTYSAVKGAQTAIPASSIAPSATSKPQSTAKPSTGSWGSDNTTTEITGSLSQTAYWTKSGKSYHFKTSCPSLSRSKNIYSGTLQDALDAGKLDPCNHCAK